VEHLVKQDIQISSPGFIKTEYIQGKNTDSMTNKNNENIKIKQELEEKLKFMENKKEDNIIPPTFVNKYKR
jgi:hypothetical protein